MSSSDEIGKDGANAELTQIGLMRVRNEVSIAASRSRQLGRARRETGVPNVTQGVPIGSVNSLQRSRDRGGRAETPARKFFEIIAETIPTVAVGDPVTTS